jgi:glyceraldehyde 3-phosphate dehydrogenase
VIPECTRPLIGINGFGRIGRAIQRTTMSNGSAAVGLINDQHSDDNNLRYLLKYDSVHGRLPEPVISDGDTWIIGDVPVKRCRQTDIHEVAWADHGVEIVIDASGVGRREQYDKIIASGVRAVIVTRQFAQADRTIIPGVSPDPSRPVSGIVSASTCDGNALALVMHRLQEFGFAAGSVTTLHPWLNDQTLLDRPVEEDGAGNYGLGRSAVTNVIPKETSAAQAAAAVIPEASQLCAISFRVPTQNVSCLDLTFRLTEADGEMSPEFLNCIFKKAARSGSPLQYTIEPLVSGDYSGCDAGATVDGRWTRRVADDWFKIVAWYDNEIGYANQVLRVTRMCKYGRQEGRDMIAVISSGDDCPSGAAFPR